MIWKQKDGKIYVGGKFYSPADPDPRYQDGWYFSDEAELPVGPYGTWQEVKRAALDYEP